MLNLVMKAVLNTLSTCRADNFLTYNYSRPYLRHHDKFSAS